MADEVEDLDLGMDKKKKKSKKTDDGEAKKAVASSGTWAAPTELGDNDIYPYADVLQRVYDSLSVNETPRPPASPQYRHEMWMMGRPRAICSRNAQVFAGS